MLRTTRGGLRRGIALFDVIVGGVILGIGLAVVISLSTRALASQTEGERQMTAAWLLDELLAMVIVEGAENYSKLYDTYGRFDPPFDQFEYEVIIDEQGQFEPFSVTAIVRWEQGRGMREQMAQTFVAPKPDDEIEDRAPVEPLDRDARWYEDEDNAL
jgi:hypothetical protein